MASCSSALNTISSLYTQRNLLIILRGITLPSLSFRSPVSMGCEISVIISTTEPRFASVGDFTRIVGVTHCRIPAFCLIFFTAVESYFYQFAGGQHTSITQFCHDNHILTHGQSDACSGKGPSTARGEMEGCNPRERILI